MSHYMLKSNQITYLCNHHVPSHIILFVELHENGTKLENFKSKPPLRPKSPNLRQTDQYLEIQTLFTSKAILTSKVFEINYQKMVVAKSTPVNPPTNISRYPQIDPREGC